MISARRNVFLFSGLILTVITNPSVVLGSKLVYSPPQPERPVVWMDYYHRKLPSTRVGDNLVTGGWADSVGRYGWDDFAHTNSFDPLFQALEKEFSLEIRQEPFTAKALSGTDIVLIINPEHPDMSPGVPVISDSEIRVLKSYVQEGGSLLVMINSEGHKTEKFEEEQLGKLLDTFGISWNSDDTWYSDIHIGKYHPYFYDMEQFHYGKGCTLNILEHAQNPQVLLEVHEDKGYPELHVRGPGLLKVDYGKGKVLVVGDTGSWGANMSRPWVENRRFLQQMFRYAKPRQDVNLPSYRAGEKRNYSYQIAQLQVIPIENTLSDLEQPYFRDYRPRPATSIPYREMSADLTVTFLSERAEKAGAAQLGIQSIHNFQDPMEFDQKQEMEIHFSRLGCVGKLQPSGEFARWMGPDAGYLFAFIPNRNIRIGDRWSKIRNLRVPTVRGADMPKTLAAEAETIYLGDEELDGYSVRKFRSSVCAWLPDLHISINDILPEKLTKQWGGNPYRLFEDRGGRLLYKAEQWIDKETGKVIKAQVQTRIVAWIQDTRKELGISNAAKDGAMITVASHIVEIKLQDV